MYIFTESDTQEISNQLSNSGNTISSQVSDCGQTFHSTTRNPKGTHVDTSLFHVDHYFIVFCINLDLQKSGIRPHDSGDNEEVDMTAGIPKRRFQNIGFKQSWSSKSSKKKSVDSFNCS